MDCYVSISRTVLGWMFSLDGLLGLCYVSISGTVLGFSFDGLLR